MKTFKLKSIEILKPFDGEIIHQSVDFLDALVIDRENDDDDWLIEIYLPNHNLEKFQKLKVKREFLLQVKISKKTNDPALFITSIKSLTPIDENFNVVCQAILVEGEKRDVDQLFSQLNFQLVTDDELIQQIKSHYHL